MHEVLPDPLPVAWWQGAQRGEFGIGLIIAGNHREGDMPRPTTRDNAFEPVWPIPRAAEQADDHQLRRADDIVDIEIDREVVAELHQIGEAQHRDVAIEPGSRLGEAGELGVGGGEDHDVAGSLAEIDRLRAIGDRPRCGGKQMHVSL